MTKGRFIEIRRSDLAAVISGTLEGRVEMVFGDSVAGIEDLGDGVRVVFERGAPRIVDLVVGADGLHSRVRQLVFGPEADFEVPLGYHVAAFEVEGYRPRDELVAVGHTAPGRQILRISFRGDRTLFLFVFRDEYLPSGQRPSGVSEIQAVLAQAFVGVGWECARILAAMKQAEDVYFDRVSQIRMPHWSLGRTVLLGDAAACVSLLAGEGSGLAMVEAYVLAGELQDCGGDPGVALGGYEERLKPFLESKQAAAVKFAPSFAPKSALGVFFRNQVSRLLQIPRVADFFIGRSVRDDFTLPDYRF